MNPSASNLSPPMTTRRPWQLARTLWRHPLLAPLNDAAAWNRLGRLFQPAFSLSQAQATVVRVEDHGADMRSLWLRPNRRFKNFRPGQHVLLELDIDGVKHARCYSFSLPPRSDRLIRLTIKRKADGFVSAAVHRLVPGQVVGLSQATGEFAAPSGIQPLLLISAGSGVTPMLSILHALADTSPQRDVRVVHCGPDETQTVCADELRLLAERWPAMRLHLHSSAESGRLDAERLERYVPDWQQRMALLCGPNGFMRAVAQLYAARPEQLQRESFGLEAPPIDPQAARHAISWGEPVQVFTAAAGQNLLEAAEAAGLQPRHGCRRGICRSCQCRKRSGSVRNLLTNEISGSGDELIQLCISTPVSRLELNLDPPRSTS